MHIVHSRQQICPHLRSFHDTLESTEAVIVHQLLHNLIYTQSKSCMHGILDVEKLKNNYNQF